jgi:uncharacterized protein YigA (DUF484 family)
MAIILDRKNEDKEFQEMIEKIKAQTGEKSAAKAVKTAVAFFAEQKGRMQSEISELYEKINNYERMFERLSLAVKRKQAAEQEIKELILNE